MQKFSHSKLSVYASCGWKYKLQYIDKNYINEDAISFDFGTLIHYIEESIANKLKNNEYVDYDYFTNLFIYGDSKCLGLKDIKNKFESDFKIKDKSDLNYIDKANIYINKGIFRLENFIKNNPSIEIIGCEIPFEYTYKNTILSGTIDRLLFDNSTQEYIIEDIKTWDDMKNHDTKSPMQLAIYSKAVAEKYQVTDLSKIKCFYDLPLLNQKIQSGTKGFINRVFTKIDKILTSIASEDFTPKPSPLCFWCAYSKTNPNQPEKAKNLCPYYSRWTQSNKINIPEFEWMGLENHEAILAEFKKRNSNKNSPNKSNANSIKIQIFKDRVLFLQR